MIWYNPADVPPPHGKEILLRMRNGAVHEGHFIKDANRYVRGVNRYRVYKLGRKTVEADEVTEWAKMPV